MTRIHSAGSVVDSALQFSHGRNVKTTCESTEYADASDVSGNIGFYANRGMRADTPAVIRNGGEEPIVLQPGESVPLHGIEHADGELQLVTFVDTDGIESE